MDRKEKNRLYARERYRNSVEAKRCPHCQIELPSEGSSKKFCDECLRKFAGHGSRQRADRRLAGLCPCGASRDVQNRKNCSICLAKAKGRFQDRKNAGVCTRCGVFPPIPGCMSCMFCKQKETLKNRDWRDRLITQAFHAYGGCACACCGLDDFAFLTLDHIEGGGNQHRKEMRETTKTTDIYTWVKKRGYPPGFQVLCMNCNWARGKFGECPHQTRKAEPFTFVA